jgi:hypothetical protein
VQLLNQPLAPLRTFVRPAQLKRETRRGPGTPAPGWVRADERGGPLEYSQWHGCKSSPGRWKGGKCHPRRVRFSSPIPWKRNTRYVLRMACRSGVQLTPGRCLWNMSRSAVTVSCLLGTFLAHIELISARVLPRISTKRLRSDTPFFLNPQAAVRRLRSEMVIYLPGLSVPASCGAAIPAALSAFRFSAFSPWRSNRRISFWRFLKLSIASPCEQPVG